MFPKSFRDKKLFSKVLLKIFRPLRYFVPPDGILEIKSFVLPIHIGRTREELLHTQDVAFHITLCFSSKGKKTDNLKDSICYFKVCETVREFCSKNKFFLIEKLAFEIYTTLKNELPPFTRIQVAVHKLNPPVPNLKGGVSYQYGDIMHYYR